MLAKLCHWRPLLTAAATAALVGGVAVPAQAATPAPSVTCSYTFTSWNGGFAANVSVANNGPAIDGWTVRWTFPSPTTDISAWSSVITETGTAQAAATNMSWNAVIPSGGAISFGWSARADTTGTPSDLTVNGTPC